MKRQTITLGKLRTLSQQAGLTIPACIRKYRDSGWILTNDNQPGSDGEKLVILHKFIG